MATTHLLFECSHHFLVALSHPAVTTLADPGFEGVERVPELMELNSVGVVTLRPEALLAGEIFRVIQHT